MNETQFSVGEKILKKIDGDGGQKVIENLSEIAPSVRNFIIEFAFGEIYSRGELNFQEREMITLASLLTAGGCENQLKVHIKGTLNVGISPKKIVEIFIQCIPYVGFPKVLNAIFVAKEIFSEQNIKL